LWKAASLPQTKGGIYNLGNPGEIAILPFAKLILSLCGRSKARIVKKPLPQDDPVRRKPDISRAKRMLKWEPKVSLKEGLLRTIDWYRGRI
jgi:nucleoside-diphosphate-sugar epimerase